ncbi:MAG: Rne/Rng family ribonuclease, partial [Gemmataceae bacterium]|nr:Rne/Rng family ribonuclease [Gemmataceae bacterium]
LPPPGEEADASAVYEEEWAPVEEARHEAHDDEAGPRRERGRRDRRGYRGGRDIGRAGSRDGFARPKPPIQDIFKRGQEVIVQVIKEGIGTKGPTLSTYISIAGRYLVLMPGLNRIGVSRKIEDEEARRRLRDILHELHPPRGLGFIIRTAGIDRNRKELQRDLVYLAKLWQIIVRRIKKQKSPCDLYQESDMVTRTIRDIFTNDIDTIWVDEPSAFEHAREFLQIVMPRFAERIKLYEDKEPMFHKYGIEREIMRIQQRHVPLPAGGSIVIDQTEALVAIDVNSGNFRADNNAETTAYQMNLQAAKEIARQLRLRDLGGVIVNDFIDMREERHRRGVEKALREAMARDRARTKILRMSQFGLIQMTRQRIRPSLRRSIYQECPCCRGTGHVKTCESMSIDVMRLLQLAVHRDYIERLEVRVHEDVAHYLLNRKRQDIVKLEQTSGKQIQIRAQPGAMPEHMEFLSYDNTGNEVRFAPYDDPPPPRPARRSGRGRRHRQDER